MPQALHVATRKGLFVFERGAKGYAPPSVHFLGDSVSMSFADPRDGTWYAALALGHFGVKLRRSDDDGPTWSEVGVPVYPEQPADLPEAEREKPFDETGSVLAMASTTGSLWISEDGGDSWTSVSQHLPPVYSVRFAPKA